MMPQYYDRTAGQQPSFNKVNASGKLATEMPEIPTKSMVADYFGYTNTNYFFSKVFFRLILPDTKYKYEDFKFTKRVPAGLAQELYQSLGWLEKRA